MKIYINARFLMQRPTGVERYAYEMCRALVKEGACITLLCPRHGEIDAAYDISGFNIVRFGVGKSHIWEQIVLPFFFIGMKNYVVVSFTGLGSILIPNKIMTIHDLSFLVNPSWFSKAYYYYYKFMTPLAVRTSKKIITVSNFSKQEILRFYGFLHDDDIIVVYNAVDREKFSLRNNVQSESSALYMLAVSSMDPRKNFSRLINVFEDVDNCKLKIVGGYNKVFKSSSTDINAKTNSNIEYLGRVSDEELQRLYANALAFIFPSIYEGFGLPTIEAMSSGCLVLTSDIPVLREVCEDAAIYFKPNDNESMLNAIYQALSMDENEKNSRINAGLENINRFSWNKSAKKLLEYIDTI